MHVYRGGKAAAAAWTKKGGKENKDKSAHIYVYIYIYKIRS